MEGLKWKRDKRGDYRATDSDGNMFAIVHWHSLWEVYTNGTLQGYDNRLKDAKKRANNIMFDFQLHQAGKVGQHENEG